MTSDHPRKPVWFPPPRPLPDPRNLPGAPLTKPVPKPVEKPKGRVWRLPWPPSQVDFFSATRQRTTKAGDLYIAAVASAIRRTLVEYDRPIRLTLTFYPPRGSAHAALVYLAEPVRYALQACGVWTSPALVRDYRFHLTADDRDNGPVRVTVTPLCP